MLDWKGIIGKSFKKEDFQGYINKLEPYFDHSYWLPQFIVLHNTALPTLSQWKHTSGEEHMKALEHYYRDTCGWSAGPHLFIDDEFIWVFTPLTLSGVHSPSWNKISWGVELVGNYEVEELGDGVKENAVTALAVLHKFGGIDPQTLRLHHEDPRTSHKSCPGKNVVKSDFIQWTTDKIQIL